MSQFADLIQAHREQLARKFADAVRLRGAATSLSDDVVIDSLGEFLDELVASLRDGPDGVERSRSATSHGVQRFGLGYDVGAVVREYAILPDLLFDLAEQTGTSILPQEQRALAKFLVNGTADAATQYGIARDEELVDQTRKHIAFLAHELRNPLGSARMAFDLVRGRGDLKPSPVADSIERSLRRVATLLDEALVSIRLQEAGALSYETLDVAELLEQLATEVAAEAEAKGQTIRIEGHASIRADRRALRSALSNLLRNAVKFTRRDGDIHLRAKASETTVNIEIEDSCGGLPDGAVHKLFDPFVQAGADRSGFGLGLAIATQATHAHGGTLRVHDLPGKGCVFILELPKADPNVGFTGTSAATR